jgi:hypothetical protein
MSLSKPTADEIISAVDRALEDANRHHEAAGRVWSALSPFIPPHLHVEAARQLAESFDAGWERYLEDVTE